MIIPFSYLPYDGVLTVAVVKPNLIFRFVDS